PAGNHKVLDDAQIEFPFGRHVLTPLVNSTFSLYRLALQKRNEHRTREYRMSSRPYAANKIKGQEHWTKKGSDVNLFIWEKRAPGGAKNGTVLFVHGSSMASQPVFDLHVEGMPNSSAMEYFCERGFDAWCTDVEGYGRSTKDRGTEAFIHEGADD